MVAAHAAGTQPRRARLEATGLEFIGAYASLPEYDKAGPEGAAVVAKLAGEARQFGTRALVVSHPGISPAGEFSEAALAAKVRVLDLAGRRAADAGLALAYHNHQPEFRNSAAEASALLADAIRRTGWPGWLIDEEEPPDQPDKPGKPATGPSRRAMKTVFGV